jgi:hypothetical protein
MSSAVGHVRGLPSVCCSARMLYLEPKDPAPDGPPGGDACGSGGAVADLEGREDANGRQWSERRRRTVELERSAHGT